MTLLEGVESSSIQFPMHSLGTPLSLQHVSSKESLLIELIPARYKIRIKIWLKMDSEIKFYRIVYHYITFRLPINGMTVEPFCSRMICLSASSSNELGIKCFIAGFAFSKFPGLNCLIRESLLLLGMRVACWILANIGLSGVIWIPPESSICRSSPFFNIWCSSWFECRADNGWEDDNTGITPSLIVVGGKSWKESALNFFAILLYFWCYKIWP